MKQIEGIKIDIQQTSLAINQNTYTEVSIGRNRWVNWEDSSSRYATISPETKRTYIVREVFHPLTKERLNFFVNVDDRGLFDSLIQITNDQIDEIRWKEQERMEVMVIPNLLAEKKEETIKKIAGLPWWKRLFNKF